VVDVTCWTKVLLSVGILRTYIFVSQFLSNNDYRDFIERINSSLTQVFEYIQHLTCDTL
jgi:hypothetical protein